MIVRTFLLALLIVWAGSTHAEQPPAASARPKDDAAVSPPAGRAADAASRGVRAPRNAAPGPAERKSASGAAPGDRTPAGGAERSDRQERPAAATSPEDDRPKRSGAASEDAAPDLADDLDSDSFGTGAEGGADAVQQANAAASLPDGGGLRFRPTRGMLLGVGALFVALLAVAVALARRDIAKVQKAIANLSERIGTVNSRIDPNVSLQIAALQRDLTLLRDRTEALERKNPNMPNAPLGGRSYEPDDFVERRPSAMAAPQPRFPALVSEVVAQSASATLRVKADPIDHDVFVASSDGAFYLVHDGSAGLCIIPAHEPMTTQLYKTYYKSSYDCGVHGAGDLYVVEPATVSARGDLWRLDRRGKLEVRAS